MKVKYHDLLKTQTSPLSKKNRMLIVDDEPILRDLASQMLNVLGYSAQSVPSGEAAIRFIKEQPVAHMIVDMLMEPGINGRLTYEEIIKICPGIKAIIASGFSETNDVKEALRLGANGFIQKPYSMIQLGRTITEAMQS